MKGREIENIFLFSLPIPVIAGGPNIADSYLDSRSTLVVILLLLVASLLVIIAGLAFSLRRQKNKLRKSHEYLVRYITSNLELKKQVPGLKEPYPFFPPDITPEEFTKIIDNMLKRLMFLPLCTLLALPLGAQHLSHKATGTMTEAMAGCATHVSESYNSLPQANSPSAKAHL